MNRLPLRWSGVVTLGVLCALLLCSAGALSAQLQLTINASPPAGEVGVSYGPVQLVSGGTPPYNCLSVTTSPQNGLTLHPDCTIDGAPIASGSTIFSAVTATDNVMPPDTGGPQDVTITVNPQLQLSGPTTLNGEVNVLAATLTFTATGGTANYSWSLTG